MRDKPLNKLHGHKPPRGSTVGRTRHSRVLEAGGRVLCLQEDAECRDGRRPLVLCLQVVGGNIAGLILCGCWYFVPLVDMPMIVYACLWLTCLVTCPIESGQLESSWSRREVL